VQEQLVAMRSAVELYALDHNGLYTSLTVLPLFTGVMDEDCDAVNAETSNWYANDSVIEPMIAKINEASGRVICAANNTYTKWAVSARLPTSPMSPSANLKWWCVDGYGTSKQFIGAIPINGGFPSYYDAKCE